jgi:hypothetical protein
LKKDPKTFPRAQRGCATTCVARRSAVERERQRRETLGTIQSCARSARGRFLVLFFKKELLSCLIAERTVFKMTSAKPGDMARRLG